MPPSAEPPLARLRHLLDAAVADPSEADAGAIADAAGEQFDLLRRTDMRSGVANMVRRLARLHASGDQAIDRDGWVLLRQAVDMLAKPGLVPGDVRRLDERLREIGLDVDYRPPMPVHEPAAKNPN